jgi:hypothetical protein
MDSKIVVTDEGPADVGRMVMLGETSRSVDAIFTATPGGNTQDSGALERAADWLNDVLLDVTDDGMTREEVMKLGDQEGHTPSAHWNARPNSSALSRNVTRRNVGARPPGTTPITRQPGTVQSPWRITITPLTA